MTRGRRGGFSMVGAAAALSVPLMAGQALAADQDFDNGCIAVVIDNHGTIITSPSAGQFSVSATAVAQQFYQTHGDDYEHLLIFPDFTTANGAFEQIVFNDVSGLGPSRPNPFNNRASFGAATRLESYTQYYNFTTFPANLETRLPGNNDSALTLIGQEFMHRWGAFPDLGATLNGGDATILRGRQNAHWNYYFNAPGTGRRAGASCLEGNTWTDNGNGTFTTSSQTDGFSELDQYLLGLRDPDAVGPMFYIQSPSGGLGNARGATPFTSSVYGVASDTVNGTRVNFTINDITAQNGARSPTAAGSRKTFKQAFILLHQGGGGAPAQAVIDQLEALRAAWTQFFAEETNFVGAVDSCINVRPIDIVFLLDLSGSFADDLPVFRAAAPGLVNDVLAISPGTRFGLASFVDFPFAPYGNAAAGDYTYRVDQPLTSVSADFISAINTAVTHDGSNLPQDQYEALYQAITGAGLDLNGNGDFTDLGDVAPSNLGRDPNNPLFVVLFTDATFNDPDLDPNYPTAAANAVVHGRSDVLGVFTPPLMDARAALAQAPLTSPGRGTLIFGEISGLGTPSLPDLPQLEELANISGGQVFPLGTDSSGFVAATRQAVHETHLPVIKPQRSLDALTVRRAAIHWGHTHNVCDDGRHGHGHGRVLGQGPGHRHARHGDDHDAGDCGFGQNDSDDNGNGDNDADDQPGHHGDDPRGDRHHSGHGDHDGDDSHHHHGQGGSPPPVDDGMSQIDFQGTLRLPGGVDFSMLNPASDVAVLVSDTPVIDQDVTFDVSSVTFHHRQHTLWRFRDCHADGGITKLDVLWTSPTDAKYRLSGKFDAPSLGLSGDRVPAEASLVMRIGSGDVTYSRDVDLDSNRWGTVNARHWLTGHGSNADGGTPSSGTSDMYALDLDITADDPADGGPSGGLSCAVGDRGAGGPVGTLVSVVLIAGWMWRRRRNRKLRA